MASTQPTSEKVPEVGESHTLPNYQPELPTYATDEVTGKVEHDLIITGEDLANVQEAAKQLDLDETREILRGVIQNHENDQNFPMQVLQSMKEFVANDDIIKNPENYATLITEMRVEAALIKDDSAYPEVRAVRS